LSLIPANHEQFFLVRRQQLALQEQVRSSQYEQLLADLNVSIAEWQDWRQRHPGPGTLTVLRAQAKWLVPWIAVVANPLLLSSPWFYSALAATNKIGPTLGGLGEHWTVRITARGILKGGGVKRRA
jgi:hypothetical protein